MMKKFLYQLYLWASRLSDFFSTVHHLHTARFAKPYELTPIMDEALEGRHLLIGQDHFNHVLAVKPTDTQQELGNLLLDGKTRAGKGLNIEANLLNWQYPAIVNDIKLELWPRTAGFREQGLHGTAFLFDPRGYGHKFDPLEGKRTDAEFQSVATTLLFRPGEKEPVFTERAITMLTQIFHAGSLEGERLLPYAQKMIYAGLYEAATVLEIISEKYDTYPNLATRFLDVDYFHADFKDKFLVSCWGTMAARMNRLLTKESVRCFTGSDFTAQDIITAKNPVSVYLHWPEKDVRSLAPLIQLVWDSLFDGMIDAYDTRQGNGCQPVLAVLDEIFRVGMPKLPHYATTVVGRNISLLVAAQSKAQLDAAYGEYEAKVLKAQFDTQIRYCPADKDTAKDIEEDLDYTSGFAHSKTEHENGTTNGENEQKIPLLPAHEIRRMDTEEIIGFRSGLRPGLRPFRARRMDWHRFPILRERAKIPPPSIPVLPLAEASPQSRYKPAPSAKREWRPRQFPQVIFPPLAA